MQIGEIEVLSTKRRRRVRGDPCNRLVIGPCGGRDPLSGGSVLGWGRADREVLRGELGNRARRWRRARFGKSLCAVFRVKAVGKPTALALCHRSMGRCRRWGCRRGEQKSREDRESWGQPVLGCGKRGGGGSSGVQWCLRRASVCYSQPRIAASSACIRIMPVARCKDGSLRAPWRTSAGPR